MRRICTGAALAAVMLGGQAATVHADAFKPSKKDQVSLGLRAARQIRSEERIVRESDPRVQMMRQVADRLLAASPTPRSDPWQFSFDLIDRPKEKNAFALPGGPIFFFTGLFDQFQTEDQVAGVLAHEIIHVRREHWAYAYADAQKRALGLSILFSIFDVGSTAADIASIGNEVILGTRFSRRHETEADVQGFDMMVRAGYNPQGMVDAFRILRGDAKGGRIPEWISTHPDIAKRITALERRIASGGPYPAQRRLPWAAQN